MSKYLKIEVDGTDVSGKTYTESQEILDTLLPDLTSELIGSVIILGQGLPQKFTSNTPSGRKEVLEHLSKSDFMIQDLKDRIERRQTDLVNSYNKNDDEIISTNSKLEVYLNQKQLKETEYKNYQKEVNYDKDISALQIEYDSRVKEIDKANKDFSELDRAYKAKSEEVNKIYEGISNQKTLMERSHSQTQQELNQKVSDQRNLVRNLESEISKLKSITDICPTCGQKIPNVIKPDTSNQEKELLKLKEDLDTFIKQKERDNFDYDEAVKQCDSNWNNNLKNTKEEQSVLYLKCQVAEETKRTLESKNNVVLASISNLTNLKNTFESNKKRVEDELKSINTEIENLTKDLKTKKDVETNLQLHIDAVNKMNTLIKRDFRGILLQDIINYIDSMMKKYSSKIFNTDEISLTLDGNNVDIVFCGKDYENLSGGEKTKIDLLVQLSIREMLKRYINFSSNILVLDECLDFLDRESSEKVLQFISSVCVDVESLFMISHHEDLDIPYDTKIIVTKDELGNSRITYQ